jgi:hypothetical protein
MHKKYRPDKKTGARNPGRIRASDHIMASGVGTKLKAINELMANRSGLQRIGAAIPIQQSWAQWLRGAVADELAGHIVSAVPRQAELVVFADSAAWGTRLRYALAALQSEIAARDSAISHIRVRVQRQ